MTRGARLWNQRAVPQVYLERDIARLQDKSGSSNPRVKREVNKQGPCTINWAGKGWAGKGFFVILVNKAAAILDWEKDQMKKVVLISAITLCLTSPVAF